VVDPEKNAIIIHGNDEIILQDKSGIETVKDDFAKMKLRKNGCRRI